MSPVGQAKLRFVAGNLWRELSESFLTTDSPMQSAVSLPCDDKFINQCGSSKASCENLCRDAIYWWNFSRFQKAVSAMCEKSVQGVFSSFEFCEDTKKILKDKRKLSEFLYELWLVVVEKSLLGVVAPKARSEFFILSFLHNRFMKSSAVFEVPFNLVSSLERSYDQIDDVFWKMFSYTPVPIGDVKLLKEMNLQLFFGRNLGLVSASRYVLINLYEMGNTTNPYLILENLFRADWVGFTESSGIQGPAREAIKYAQKIAGMNLFPTDFEIKYFTESNLTYKESEKSFYDFNYYPGIYSLEESFYNKDKLLEFQKIVSKTFFNSRPGFSSMWKQVSSLYFKRDWKEIVYFDDRCRSCPEQDTTCEELCKEVFYWHNLQEFRNNLVIESDKDKEHSLYYQKAISLLETNDSTSFSSELFAYARDNTSLSPELKIFLFKLIFRYYSYSFSPAIYCSYKDKLESRGLWLKLSDFYLGQKLVEFPNNKTFNCCRQANAYEYLVDAINRVLQELNRDEVKNATLISQAADHKNWFRSDWGIWSIPSIRNLLEEVLKKN